MSTTRRARTRRHDEDDHDEPDERWAVSYSDMVTVLMCLFIVLYAVSIVDDTKYEQLKNGLAEAFGQSQTQGGGDFTEGLLAIHAGSAPRLVQERLDALVSVKPKAATKKTAEAAP